MLAAEDATAWVDSVLRLASKPCCVWECGGRNMPAFKIRTCSGKLFARNAATAALTDLQEQQSDHLTNGRGHGAPSGDQQVGAYSKDARSSCSMSTLAPSPTVPLISSTALRTVCSSVGS